METFATPVVRDEDGVHVGHEGVNQRFEAIGHRVVRMEDVEEVGAVGQHVLAVHAHVHHSVEQSYQYQSIQSNFNFND